MFFMEIWRCCDIEVGGLSSRCWGLDPELLSKCSTIELPLQLQSAYPVNRERLDGGFVTVTQGVAGVVSRYHLCQTAMNSSDRLKFEKCSCCKLNVREWPCAPDLQSFPKCHKIAIVMIICPCYLKEIIHSLTGGEAQCSQAYRTLGIPHLARHPPNYTQVCVLSKPPALG